MKDHPLSLLFHALDDDFQMDSADFGKLGTDFLKLAEGTISATVSSKSARISRRRLAMIFKVRAPTSLISATSSLGELSGLKLFDEDFVKFGDALTNVGMTLSKVSEDYSTIGRDLLPPLSEGSDTLKLDQVLTNSASDFVRAGPGLIEAGHEPHCARSGVPEDRRRATFQAGRRALSWRPGWRTGCHGPSDPKWRTWYC